MRATFRGEIELSLDPRAAFDLLVDVLRAALAHRGIRWETGPIGYMASGSVQVARIIQWREGERILLGLDPVFGSVEEKVEVEVLFKPTGAGTTVAFVVKDWSALLRDQGDGLGWFASQVVAPVLSAMQPAALGDWIADRVDGPPADED